MNPQPGRMSTGRVWLVAIFVGCIINGALLAYAWYLRAQLDQDNAQRVLHARVGAIAFSSDGTRIYCGCSDRVVRAFDVATRKVSMWRGHQHSILTVTASLDGNTVVSGSAGNDVIVLEQAYAPLC
jgi:WD40 repeat protein